MKSKYNTKLWGGRFKKEPNKLAEEYSQSISFDYRLYKCDIQGTIAHVMMLQKCKYLTGSESKKIIKALGDIEKEISLKIKQKKFIPHQQFEDIHTYIEKKVVQKVGDIVGSKIHTARSRNDQIAVDLRLYIRDDIKQLLALIDCFCKVILYLSKKYKYLVMPGYTHMQLAKSINFSDYISAYYEMLSRDKDRIIDCQKRLNFCPLGSGAVGGTYYTKIDRNFVSDKLNFIAPVPNTVDAVSDRDFVIEYVFDLALIMLHISRLSEDLVIFLSPQYQFIKIDESFMTGSSILPQKKNPDVCELARAKASRVYGNLMTLLTVMKGLPMTYNRDMQEVQEPFFDSSDTVKQTLKVYTEMLKTVEVDKNKILQALKQKNSFSSAPIIVDTLTERGMPLRKSHEFVGELIKYCEKNNIDFNKFK